MLYVVSVSAVVTLQPFISLPSCTDVSTSVEYANPAYVDIICRRTRFACLLFLTPDECDFGRRLVAAVVLGGCIGWERRQADRPAGIRTMALVALGSSLFTICSAYAFISGPMEWDASRISAAIPSGVGFLGAGLIFKQAQKDERTGESSHVVLGITTATSLWLSAAVGVACGGALYFVSFFAAAIMLVLLRFGPRAIHDPNADAEAFVSPHTILDHWMAVLRLVFRRGIGLVHREVYRLISGSHRPCCSDRRVGCRFDKDLN